MLPTVDSRAALIIAHPSHELRVHGWLERARPLTFVLTDGGGREAVPRIDATTTVLKNVGARPGALYGALTDLGLYRSILEQDFDVFIGMADQLAGALVAEQIDYVAGDAEEGYSSAHDLCRILIDAAIEIARRKYEHAIENFDFLVIAAPEPAGASIDAIWIHLDEGEFIRKVTAARAYNPRIAADIEAALRGEPFQGIRSFSEPQLEGTVDEALIRRTLAMIETLPSLKQRVSAVLGGIDLGAFKVECLRSMSGNTSRDQEEPRYFELYGEKLVEAGRYPDVIRYRQHLAPIKDALWRHVESK
ncbi:MAG: hypothetical protein ABI882_17185 [Acidobacteriota bacterium]